MPYLDKNNRWERGLCRECPEPLKQPYKRCEKCLEMDRKTARKRNVKLRAKREKLGLCVKCGMELNQDEARGRKNCINCREERKWNHLINK